MLRHSIQKSLLRVPRKDVGKPKPRAKASNEHCWQRFAELAKSLGFESDNIERLWSQNTDTRMAIDFLRHVRPDDLYQMPNETRTASALEICHILRSKEGHMNSIHEDLQNTQYSETPTQHRYGRPYDKSYKESKCRFSLSDGYATKTKTLTHITVNRDIFHAFFGSELHVTLDQTDTAHNMDVDNKNAQPVAVIEASQPNVSPMSEQPEEPEEPEGQQPIQESPESLLPREADTNVESTNGGELKIVLWSDKTPTQPITGTRVVAVIEQQRDERGNDGTLQVQTVKDTAGEIACQAEMAREVEAIRKADLEASDSHGSW